MSQQRSYQGDNEILVEENRRLYKWIKGLEKELESLKSRLPVNADGDVVLWGDEQFYIDSTDDSVVNSFVVEEIVREEKRFGFLSMDDVIHLPEDCHSTAESCRKAHAANGGGE